MTLEEMKVAVCEKLPECMTRIGPRYYWKKDNKVSGDVCNVDINWPTEGLAVCHEAEKLLKVSGPFSEYAYKLGKIVGIDYGKVILSITEQGLIAHASYRQRLEALCRVWYPERF